MKVPSNKYECLAIYKRKRLQWLEMLGSFNPDSLCLEHDLCNFVDRTLLFETVRTILLERKGVSKTVNLPLWRIFYDGYLALQGTAIRRLISTQRDDISLTNILSDIRNCNNHGIMTRYNHVNATSQNENDVAYANAIFDKISGISLDKRKESDRISDEVFSKISNALNNSAAPFIAKIVSKEFAHRCARVSYSEPKPNIEDGYKAVKVMIAIHSYITARILQGGGLISYTFIHQDDLFKNIEGFMLLEGEKEKAIEIYEKRQTEYEISHDFWQTNLGLE
jgi:hypothetical protein